MTSDPKAELVRELGEQIEVLGELTEGEAAELLELFRGARLEEQRQLDAAIDATLRAFPRVFRGPVRKVMFG